MYYKKKENKFLNLLKRNKFLITFCIIGAASGITLGYFYKNTGLFVIGITSLLSLIGHNLDSKE
ncbi:MAG: hypothetical protein ACLFPJ_03755 [Candidatus Woesearchaeota archaeon]